MTTSSHPTTTNLVVAAVVAAVLAGGCGGQRTAAPPPANVLLLVIDCLRADRVGAETDYPRPVAPHLSALAAEGTSFTRAFAQASWTRPSVPTLLTGLYPSEHGLGAFQQEGDEVTGGSLSPAAVTAAEALRALGYATALFGQQNQLAPRFGLDQGFDVYDHKASKADRIHGLLLDWLEREPKRPFFAYLHYLELHWPYCAPPETRGLFTAGYQGRPLCADWRRLRDQIRSGEIMLTPEEIDAMRGQYDEELVALDRKIGRLFDGLRQRGLWDETLIAVTSDHGEEFFEHGGMAHGTSLYDELIQVPLVIKAPRSWGAAGGVKVAALVEHRDLLPTFLEAGGASVSQPPAAETSSARRSLAAWMRGAQGVEREFVVAELGDLIAVRTADHKLIVGPEHDAQLFDLARDPGETRDVAAEEPETVSRLEGALRRWRASLQPIAPGAETLDDETIEGLRGLGYLD